jgi:Fur family zinc uptake transcriptional regulator
MGKLVQRAEHDCELTKNQSLVYDILSKASGPLSAYSILDDLRGEGLQAPPQVYRALEKLLKIGLIHRLESMNAFIACRDPECVSHQVAGFAICDDCGQVVEFAGKKISSQLKSWEKDSGFSVHKTTIELRGICASCG